MLAVPIRGVWQKRGAKRLDRAVSCLSDGDDRAQGDVCRRCPVFSSPPPLCTCALFVLTQLASSEPVQRHAARPHHADVIVAEAVRPQQPRLPIGASISSKPSPALIGRNATLNFFEGDVSFLTQMGGGRVIAYALSPLCSFIRLRRTVFRCVQSLSPARGLRR